MAGIIKQNTWQFYTAGKVFYSTDLGILNLNAC